MRGNFFKAKQEGIVQVLETDNVSYSFLRKGALMVAVVTAQKAYLALTMAKKAMGVVTVALMIKQKALNAVMAINPIGLVVIGLTALVAIFMKATKWAGESAKAWGKQNSELGKIETSVDKAKKANEGLATSLSKLLQDENSSAAAKKKVRERVDDLIKKYPNLTAEIIRNAAANNTLNGVLALQAKIQGLEEKAKAVEELTKAYGDLHSKTTGMDFREFVTQLESLGDEDLFAKVFQSIKGTDWDRDISKELAQRLSTDVAVAYSDMFPLIKQKISKERGGWASFLEFASFGLTGTTAKLITKLKENAKLMGSTSVEAIKEEIEESRAKIEALANGVKPVELGAPVSTGSAIKVTDKEFNALKKSVKDNLSGLDKEIKEVDKKLEELKKPFEGEFFTPVDVGDDPWGMQKVLDLTGELSLEIGNQTKRVADSIKKSSKILKLEQEKANLEEKKLFENDNLDILEKAGDEKTKAFDEVTARQKEALEKGAKELAGSTWIKWTGNLGILEIN